MPGIRRENGGNCDIKNLSRGCKVYFPVFVEGAKLSVGDMHFSQAGTLRWRAPRLAAFLGPACGTAICICPYVAPIGRFARFSKGYKHSSRVGAQRCRGPLSLFIGTVADKANPSLCCETPGQACCRASNCAPRAVCTTRAELVGPLCEMHYAGKPGWALLQ